MDCISSFDIRLDKDIYYAGEALNGHVILDNTENVKIRGELVFVGWSIKLFSYVTSRHSCGSSR